MREWIGEVGLKTLSGEPDSPRENREIFCTAAEARVLIERWRERHNRVRPHSALGYRPPGPEGDRCWTVLRFAPGRPTAPSGSDDYCVNDGLHGGVSSPPKMAEAEASGFGFKLESG